MNRYGSTIARARLVQKITAENYEPGRQDWCKSWVWRNKVYPLLGISIATYFRLLAVNTDNVK